MHSLASFLEASATLARAVNRFAEEHDIAHRADIDHFCYKCGSTAEFEYLRMILEQSSMFIYQSMIAGRRIALIGLNVPFESVFGNTHLLELSDQKPDGSQKGGFDHVEVVPRDGKYEELKTLLYARGAASARKDRPHHVTDDYELPGGFTLRLTPQLLLDKVKAEEFRY